MQIARIASALSEAAGGTLDVTDAAHGVAEFGEQKRLSDECCNEILALH